MKPIKIIRASALLLITMNIFTADAKPAAARGVPEQNIVYAGSDDLLFDAAISTLLQRMTSSLRSHLLNTPVPSKKKRGIWNRSHHHAKK
ncbi:MAG: hypothetical protein ABIQ74_11195 [Chitinophagales bacterium]